MRKRLLLAVAAASVISLIIVASAQAVGGTVIGWGDNGDGQVGAGTTGENVKTPTPVPNLAEVTEVSRGGVFTAALRSNGGVVAWGGNEYGELGDGSTTQSSVPVPVSGLPGAVAVSASVHGSIALLPNGTVMAWGSNVYGGLGQGATAGPETCGAVPCSKKPLLVQGLTNVIAIASGYDYFLALRSDGTVWFWGYDFYGESGNGTGTQGGCDCIDHPVQVPGVTGAVAISADWYLASVLLANGTIKDWGYNIEGQVGDGSLNTDPTCGCSGPVTVLGVVGVKETTSGGYHGLALFAGGAGFSWGEDLYGQLGNGVFMETGCDCFPFPAPIPGFTGARQLDAGPYASYALMGDGTLRSWGNNSDYALGDGTEVHRNTPIPIAAAGVSAIAAGDYGAEAIVGPSQTLKIELAGAGTGTVGGDGIICPGAGCENTFAQGAIKVLRAEANAGAPFAGFSGPCTGTGTGTCQVAMTQNQTVVATFGAPKGTAISKAKISSKKKSAEFSFSAPGAITGYECKLIRPRKHAKKQGKGGKASKAKKKAKPAKFLGCASGRTYKNLAPGAYTFKVRGLDIVGADATPAVRHFKIKQIKPKKHRKHHKKH